MNRVGIGGDGDGGDELLGTAIALATLREGSDAVLQSGFWVL